jgi:hypothetical protein
MRWPFISANARVVEHRLEASVGYPQCLFGSLATGLGMGALNRSPGPLGGGEGKLDLEFGPVSPLLLVN